MVQQEQLQKTKISLKKFNLALVKMLPTEGTPSTKKLRR